MGVLQQVDNLIDEILTVIPGPPDAVLMSRFGENFQHKYGVTPTSKVKSTPTLSGYKTLLQFFKQHSAIVACVTVMGNGGSEGTQALTLTPRGVERRDKASSTPVPEPERAAPREANVTHAASPASSRPPESPTDQLVDKLIVLIPESPDDAIGFGDLASATKAKYGCDPTSMLRTIPQLGGCSLPQFLSRHPAMSSFVVVRQTSTEHAHPHTHASALVNLTAKGAARVAAAQKTIHAVASSSSAAAAMELPPPTPPTRLTRARFADRLRSLIPPPPASIWCSVLSNVYLERHGSSLEDDLETVASTRELLYVIGLRANNEMSASVVVISAPAAGGTPGKVSVSLSPLGVELVLEQHAPPDCTFPVTTFNVKVTAVNPGQSLVADDCVYCPWSLLHHAADWEVGDMISMSAFYYPDSASGCQFRACSFAVRSSSIRAPPLPLPPVGLASATPAAGTLASTLSGVPALSEQVSAGAFAPKVLTQLGHPGSCSACIKWSMHFSDKKKAIYFTCASEPAKWQKSLTEGASFAKPVGCTCGCPRMSISPVSAKQQLAARNANNGCPSTPPLSPGTSQMTSNRITTAVSSSFAAGSSDADDDDDDEAILFPNRNDDDGAVDDSHGDSNSNDDDDDDDDDDIFGSHRSGGYQKQAEWTSEDDETLIAVVRARGSELSAQYAVPKHLEDEIAEDFNARNGGPPRTGLTLATRWKETLRKKNCQNIDMFSSSQSSRRPVMATATTTAAAAPKPSDRGRATKSAKRQVLWDDDQMQRLHDLVAEHMKPNGVADFAKVTAAFNVLQDADKHRTKQGIDQHWRMKAQYWKPGQARKVFGFWDETRNARLCRLVDEHGEGNWAVITEQFNTDEPDSNKHRTPGSLPIQWRRLQKPTDAGKVESEAMQSATPLPTPSHTKHGWTEDEDEELTRAVQIHGSSWPEVLARFNTARGPEAQRTLQSLRTRWNKGRVGASSSPATSSVAAGGKAEPPVNTWTDEQHDHLAQLVDTYGSSWYRISAMLNASFPSIVRLPNTISKYWDKHGKQNVTALPTGAATQASQPIPTSDFAGTRVFPATGTTKTGRTFQKWDNDQHQLLTELVAKHVSDWVSIHFDFNALQELDRHRTKACLREHWRIREQWRNRESQLPEPTTSPADSSSAVPVSIPAASHRRTTVSPSAFEQWTADDDAIAVRLIKRRAAELTANYAIPRGSTAADFAEDFNKEAGSALTRTGADLAERWRSVLRKTHAASLNPFNTQRSAAPQIPAPMSSGSSSQAHSIAKTPIPRRVRGLAWDKSEDELLTRLVQQQDIDMPLAAMMWTGLVKVFNAQQFEELAPRTVQGVKARWYKVLKKRTTVESPPDARPMSQLASYQGPVADDPGPVSSDENDDDGDDGSDVNSDLHRSKSAAVAPSVNSDEHRQCTVISDTDTDDDAGIIFQPQMSPDEHRSGEDDGDVVLMEDEDRIQAEKDRVADVEARQEFARMMAGLNP